MKNKRNYLDYIPVKNPKFNWRDTDDGFVVVEVIREGIFDKLVQKVFKVPKKSEIQLDERGSFVWKSIDDSKDLGQIADEVRRKFDDNEEVMYQRLIKFINILKENKFITLKFNGIE